MRHFDDDFTVILCCNSTESYFWNKTADMDTVHFYAQGLAIPPQNAVIVGGKTGTEDLAGSCLILLEKDLQEILIFLLIMEH